MCTLGPESPGTVPASANGRGYAFREPSFATGVRVRVTLPIVIAIVPNIGQSALPDVGADGEVFGIVRRVATRGP